MRTDVAQPVHLADYMPTDYIVETVDLDFRLHENATRVVARTRFRPNPKGRAGAPLTLDGDGLNPVKVALDGLTLDHAAVASPNRLTIPLPPGQPFTFGG